MFLLQVASQITTLLQCCMEVMLSTTIVLSDLTQQPTKVVIGIHMLGICGRQHMAAAVCPPATSRVLRVKARHTGVEWHSSMLTMTGRTISQLHQIWFAHKQHRITTTIIKDYVE